MRRKGLLGVCAYLTIVLRPVNAEAQQAALGAAQLLPTFTPTGEMQAPSPLRTPTAADGLLAQRARELDALLGEAAQDLGLTVRIANRSEMGPQEAQEGRLIERATRDDRWQISPRIEEAGRSLIIRLVVVSPGSKTALVQVDRVEPADLAVRAVVMLRDLVRMGQGAPSREAHRMRSVEALPAHEHDQRAPSEGKATLATSAAVLGGFVGYSLQKSSGSDDVRLTYPLLALGAGIGVGASLIVSEEWDVRISDAWYLTAGAAWPTAGGLLIARGREVEPESDRYAFGIAGGLGGLALTSVALSRGHVTEAGAAVAHSGGALGTALGGASELAWRGTTTRAPYAGMGYGAVAGVVLGSFVGTQVKGSASRVLMIDLGAGLGALSAAAAASPLVFGERTEKRDRVWIATSMAGAVAGAAVAYLWTSTSHGSKAARAFNYGSPTAGVIGSSQAADGSNSPVLGVGWNGMF